MEYTRIYTLLDKYWECATSVEEERELRHFFDSEVVPPDLQPYKSWFIHPDAEELTLLGEDFDRKVMESIHAEKKRINRRYIQYTICLILIILSLLGLIFYLVFPTFSI